MFIGHNRYVVNLVLPSLLLLCGVLPSLKLAQTRSVHVSLAVVGCFQSHEMHRRAYRDVTNCPSKLFSVIIIILIVSRVIVIVAKVHASQWTSLGLKTLRP